MVSLGLGQNSKKSNVEGDLNLKVKNGKANASIRGNVNGSDESENPFKTEFLNAHNECRRRHNVPPATWSDDLAKGAQNWANLIAKNGKFQHSKPNQRKGLGENIACAGGQHLGGRKTTMMWYDEIKDYDFNSKPRYNPNCGHFTQVIWAESTKLGAGTATDKKGMTYVVGRYSPAGNLINTFEDNIKPPVGELASLPDQENDEVITHTLLMDDFEAPNQNSIVFPDSNGKLTMTFRMKKIRVEDPRKGVINPVTAEVNVRSAPVNSATYMARSLEYLQPGKSYLVTHSSY